MKTNTKHGPGAAHIGFSMFGARGPLLAPEDAGAGASAPTGDVTTTTAATATTTTGDPATAPGAASEKMLPQSQVNTLIAEAKRAAKEAARRELEAAQPRKDPPKDPPRTDSTLTQADVQMLMARERSFGRAAAGIDGGRLERMEKAFLAESPSDVAAWVKAYREDMGFDVKPPEQVTQPAAASTPAPAGPAPTPAAAPSAPTGPVNPITTGGILDIFNLTPAQLQKMGPAGVRAELDKIRDLHHQTSGLARLPRVPERK